MAAQDRVHSLDAVRAFALLLGVAFHACMSFVPGMLPGLWVTVDKTPSVALGELFFVAHIFRMSLFFVMAGYFARLLYMRSGLRGFWVNRLKRIAVPMIVGWCVIFPIFIVVETWGLREVFGGHLPQAPKMPPGFFPFMHFWFLYALLLLYPTVLGLRRVFLWVDRGGMMRALVDRVSTAIIATPAAVVLAPMVLGATLALTLYLRKGWIYWGGIPAQDVTYIPQLTVMVGFGTAMIVGWLLHRRADLLQSLEKRWVGHFVVAVGATLYCCYVAGTKMVFVPAPMDASKAYFAISYVVALWSWVLGFIGVSLRFLSGENRAIRYVADSSYWIYIAHLPVVATLDIVVRDWPVHWVLKYGFVVAVSFGLLFLSYHYLVRPTFVGKWLNGRKYPRHPSPTVPVAGMRMA